jgi:SAM-dependent methyltransferase
MSVSKDNRGFDRYATNYHDELNRGLALSGENSDYFARARVALSGFYLERLGARPATVLDFGCGIGSTVPLLLELPGVESVIGTDASTASLDVARGRGLGSRASFQTLDQSLEGCVDLAYCNGVFHHIPPSERPAALRYVARGLRSGGLFALWENNPWNPGTRLIMNRIPFDRDAEMLSARATRRMLRDAGFEVLRTNFAFIFPHALRALRPLERHAARLPLGGQYMVLARPLS